MFEISKIPLEKLDMRQGFCAANTGAFCSFEGWVRNHNNGKDVLGLEYEAHEPLCCKETEQIFIEVRERFNVISMRVFHRVGRLGIGEMAVWVGVIAEHRDDSFKACRYIIDEIKKRLPIWKKEHYANGESQWVACHAKTGDDIPAPEGIGNPS